MNERQQHIQNSLMYLSDQQHDGRVFDYKTQLYQSSYPRDTPGVFSNNARINNYQHEVISSWDTNSHRLNLVVNSDRSGGSSAKELLFRSSLPRIDRNNVGSNYQLATNQTIHMPSSIIVHQSNCSEQALIVTRLNNNNKKILPTKLAEKDYAKFKMTTLLLKLPIETNLPGPKPCREIIHYKPLDLSRSYQTARRSLSQSSSPVSLKNPPFVPGSRKNPGIPSLLDESMMKRWQAKITKRKDKQKETLLNNLQESLQGTLILDPLWLMRKRRRAQAKRHPL